MPIYEYRCTACQHKLETLQKFSDAPLVTCPECGKPALTKLVSAAGFQLKGSGWYQTDFRGSGSAKKPDAPAGDTSTGEAGAKTEATPAASDSKTASTDSAASKPAAPAPASDSKAA